MIEEPLTALGATKSVLDEESLSRAYRCACRGVLVQEAADQAAEEMADRVFAVSDDFAAQVAAKLEGTTNTWDDAVWELACHQRPAEINAEAGGE
jgi:hypothetical protein